MKNWFDLSTLSIIIGLTCFPVSSFLFAQETEVQTATTTIYADQELGEMLIKKDPKESFFNSIGKLDMEIQMGIPADSIDGRNEVLTVYRDYLKTDIAEFSQYEKNRLSKLMDEAIENVNGLNPSLLTDTIFGYKIRGRCYGPSAFYTRGKCIAFPSAMLLTMDDEELLSVIYHELFHIISRYHPDLRKEMYKKVGYREVAPPVVFPEQLKERLLLNPDGMAYPVIVELSTPEGDVYAIPVLYSRWNSWESSKKQFFQYMQFSLFQVKIKDGGGLELIVDELGGSTLTGPAINQAYYNKIGTNTNYIIHPDEILADNFGLVLKGKDSGAVQNLDGPGKELLADLQDILSSYDGAEQDK